MLAGSGASCERVAGFRIQRPGSRSNEDVPDAAEAPLPIAVDRQENPIRSQGPAQQVERGIPSLFDRGLFLWPRTERDAKRRLRGVVLRLERRVPVVAVRRIDDRDLRPVESGVDQRAK